MNLKKCRLELEENDEGLAERQGGRGWHTLVIELLQEKTCNLTRTEISLAECWAKKQESRQGPDLERLEC